MTTVVSFPVDQIVEFEAMASVDRTVWWRRLCGREGTARTTSKRPMTLLRIWALTTAVITGLATLSPSRRAWLFVDT
jgi:hypothetical protein